MKQVQWNYIYCSALLKDFFPPVTFGFIDPND